jgi:hypothetical protein
VRYLLLPFGTSPPVDAKLVQTAGDFQLWSVASTVPGTGYVQVVDTQGSPIAENRLDVGAESASFLGSNLALEGRYPTVAWDGGTAPAPTLSPGASPAGPAGRVVSDRVELTDGYVRAVVVANRRAVVLLKASFDPGWRVEVDGRTARTEMIAPALVGVTVAPGRHVVTFSYVGYSWYPLFFAISGLSLLVLLARYLLARSVLARRRRRPSVPVRGAPDPASSWEARLAVPGGADAERDLSESQAWS